MRVDREGPPQQIDAAALTAAAQKDHAAFEQGAQVELEAFGGGAPAGREFWPGGSLGAIGRDIPGGDARQGISIGEAVALPDLALSPAITTFSRSDGKSIANLPLAIHYRRQIFSAPSAPLDGSHGGSKRNRSPTEKHTPQLADMRRPFRGCTGRAFILKGKLSI